MISIKILVGNIVRLKIIIIDCYQLAAMTESGNVELDVMTTNRLLGLNCFISR